MQERWGSLSDPGHFCVWGGVSFLKPFLSTVRDFQGVFSELSPSPQCVRDSLGFFPLVFVASSTKAQDLFWDLWIITILVVLHLHVVGICHCELLLQRRLMQFDRRKTASCLMTCFFCTVGHTWGIKTPTHMAEACNCSTGKHEEFKLSSGHGSSRTFFYCNRQGAIATPTGHWTHSLCHSLKHGLIHAEMGMNKSCMYPLLFSGTSQAITVSAGGLK